MSDLSINGEHEAYFSTIVTRSSSACTHRLYTSIEDSRLQIYKKIMRLSSDFREVIYHIRR